MTYLLSSVNTIPLGSAIYVYVCVCVHYHNDLGILHFLKENGFIFTAKLLTFCLVKVHLVQPVVLGNNLCIDDWKSHITFCILTDTWPYCNFSNSLCKVSCKIFKGVKDGNGRLSIFVHIRFLILVVLSPMQKILP